MRGRCIPQQQSQQRRPCCPLCQPRACWTWPCSVQQTVGAAKRSPAGRCGSSLVGWWRSLLAGLLCCAFVQLNFNSGNCVDWFPFLQKQFYCQRKTLKLFKGGVHCGAARVRPEGHCGGTCTLRRDTRLSSRVLRNPSRASACSAVSTCTPTLTTESKTPAFT